MHVLTIKFEEKEKKMTLAQFLEKAVKSSVEKLVRAFTDEVAKATEFGGMFITKAAAAISVLRAMKMEEELRLFGLLLESTCGRMGMRVPQELTTQPSKPAAPALAVAATAAQAPAPPAARPVPAPQPPDNAKTGPARRIEKSVEEQVSSWRGILGSFLRGSRIDFEKTIALTTAVVTKYRNRFTESDWKLLFSAMGKANGIGRYLLDNKANPPHFFEAAPPNLLDEYLFGQDGAMTNILTSFSELGEETEKLPGWLVAETSILLDGVLALDCRQELDPFAVRQLEQLLGRLQQNNGPDFLFEKLMSVLPPGETETPAPKEVPRGGVPRIKGDLNSVVQKPDGDHSAVEKAKAAAASFAGAIKGLAGGQPTDGANGSNGNEPLPEMSGSDTAPAA